MRQHRQHKESHTSEEAGHWLYAPLKKGRWEGKGWGLKGVTFPLQVQVDLPGFFTNHIQVFPHLTLTQAV